MLGLVGLHIGVALVGLGGALQLGRRRGDRAGGMAYLDDGLAEVRGGAAQGAHDAVRMAGGGALVQAALGQPADGGGHGVGFAAQGGTHLANDQDGDGDAQQQGEGAGDQHQPAEAAGDAADLAQVAAGDGFFVIDERIDALEPLDIGRRDALQQEHPGAFQIAGLAQLQQALGQRQGGAFDVLDGRQQALFLGRGALAGEQLIHGLGGLAIEGLEPVDVGQATGQGRGVVDQHRIANGDGAVVHAAAEVDGVALLDAGALADGGQGVIDDADALDADEGDQQHQHQDQAEAQAQAGGHGKGGTHENLNASKCVTWITFCVKGLRDKFTSGRAVIPQV